MRNEEDMEVTQAPKPKKGFRGKVAGAIIGGAFLLGMLTGTYTLSETQQAVVTRLGRPVREYVGSTIPGQPDSERIELAEQWAEANGYPDVEVDSSVGVLGTGLHFKIPFIERVWKVSDQMLEYSSDPEQVQTKDKRQLVVDSYTKFYINNPLSFYLKVGSVNSGLARLDDIMYSTTRNNISSEDFDENIRTTNRQVMALDGAVGLDSIETGREVVLENIITDSHYSVQNLGIDIVDTRFISVDLPDQNEKSVYDRMIAERDRIASLYQSQGISESTQIRSAADRDAAQIKANALLEAGQIRGDGESMAASIYTEASRQDPEFFKFWRTMRAYESALQSGKSSLLLTTDSEFLRYMQSMDMPAEGQ